LISQKIAAILRISQSDISLLVGVAVERNPSIRVYKPFPKGYHRAKDKDKDKDKDSIINIINV